MRTSLIGSMTVTRAGRMRSTSLDFDGDARPWGAGGHDEHEEARTPHRDGCGRPRGRRRFHRHGGEGPDLRPERPLRAARRAQPRGRGRLLLALGPLGGRGPRDRTHVQRAHRPDRRGLPPRLLGPAERPSPTRGRMRFHRSGSSRSTSLRRAACSSCRRPGCSARRRRSGPTWSRPS